MLAGPALNELCIAIARLKSVYAPRDRQLLSEYARVHGVGLSHAALRMEELSRGLVLKIYSLATRADGEWSPEEQALGAYLISEFWSQELKGEALRQAWAKLMTDSAKLQWEALVQPFVRYKALRTFQDEVFTIGNHIANIIVKADGLVEPSETKILRDITHALELALFHSSAEEGGQRGADDSDPRSVPSRGRQSHKNPSSQRASRNAEDDNAPVLVPETDTSGPGLEESMATLDRLIGLGSVKTKVHELTSFLQMQQQRVRMGLPSSSHALHMTFTGNPGTGKTTVARIIAHILRGIGILKRGHLVETDRSGLVAEYAGQTAVKCDKKIEEALDGVLFIDEAYSLIDSSGDDAFGREAVQTLLKRMEDHRDRLIVILAGYTAPLDEMLKSNPGLTSRIGANLDFPDYEPTELMAIYRSLCKEHQYVLPAEAELLALRGLIAQHAKRDEHFGNGRTVRNAFELAIRRMAIRIASLTPITHELLTHIKPEDIAFPGMSDTEWKEVIEDPKTARFRCNGCEQRITGTDSQLLQESKCPKCGERFLLGLLREVKW